MKKIYVSDLSDNRMIYAIERLMKMGYEIVSKIENADFTLLPPNSKESYKRVDYLGNESFALKNAYLTAESAIAIAVCESTKSLSSANILIIGYGRIGKALHKYLSAFTTGITICARNREQRALAEMNNATAVDLKSLGEEKSYDFVFNTVPFPVMNDKELKTLNKNALIIDLASFPGGVDKHISEALGIKLVQAWGLPGRYSPETAGEYVAEAVDEIVREGKL